MFDLADKGLSQRLLKLIQFWRFFLHTFFFFFSSSFFFFSSEVTPTPTAVKVGDPSTWTGLAWPALTCLTAGGGRFSAKTLFRVVAAGGTTSSDEYRARRAAWKRG